MADMDIAAGTEVPYHAGATALISISGTANAIRQARFRFSFRIAPDTTVGTETLGPPS
jgi:hypothetical protein